MWMDPARRLAPIAIALVVVCVPWSSMSRPGRGVGAASLDHASTPLFTDDFSRDLAGWHLVGERAVAIRESGDPQHGPVLELTPNGDVVALIRGSERWPHVRLEGEMLFPTPTDNYLGYVYNHSQTGGRQDFGVVYVKGNESYLQVNPHRDFNVSRTIYPELRVPLVGPAAVTTGHWQRFAVEVSGASVHVYVGAGGVPQLTFDGFERRRGAIGVQPRSVGGPVWVDNLVVREIDRLTYEGPPIPQATYSRHALLTEWQVAGPFERTTDHLAQHPQAGRWTHFETDQRGAVVTGRVVDFHGPRTVAYFRTRVTMPRAGEAWLQISTVDDAALWVNGRFHWFIARQGAAWFDLATNPAHEGQRIPLAVEAGVNELVLRVRGGTYATGGFFARLVQDVK